jgi:DNA (cytosine-5)-methyltransferase 1
LTTSNQRLDGDTETFLVFRIATRPHNAAEAERWEEATTANTIDGFNERHEPPPHLVVVGALVEGDGAPRQLQAAYSGHLFPDAIGVRRLTPRECERLQGFPDDWTADQSDAQRYRQLGNAVAVPVVEWIARRLVAYDTALVNREVAV